MSSLAGASCAAGPQHAAAPPPRARVAAPPFRVPLTKAKDGATADPPPPPWRPHAAISMPGRRPGTSHAMPHPEVAPASGGGRHTPPSIPSLAMEQRAPHAPAHPLFLHAARPLSFCPKQANDRNGVCPHSPPPPAAGQRLPCPYLPRSRRHDRSLLRLLTRPQPPPLPPLPTIVATAAAPSCLRPTGKAEADGWWGGGRAGGGGHTPHTKNAQRMSRSDGTHPRAPHRSERGHRLKEEEAGLGLRRGRPLRNRVERGRGRPNRRSYPRRAAALAQ